MLRRIGVLRRSATTFSCASEGRMPVPALWKIALKKQKGGLLTSFLLFARSFALLNQTPIAQFGYCFNQKAIQISALS